MGFRYRVNDLPVVGVGGFTPLPSTNPIASSWGLVKVFGILGTGPIPTGSPELRKSAPQDAPNYQGTQNAPDYFLPAVYWTNPRNMGPIADAGVGMATRRHTPMPVPATQIIATPRNAMIGRKTGGRTAMAWPRAFQRFPIKRQGTTRG